MEVMQRKSKVPSYLKAFNLDYDDIVLIFAKKPSVELDSTVPVDEVSIVEESTLDEFETTGNPLHVDLGGSDDTVLINLVTMEAVRKPWSPDECKHYPLPAFEARGLISKYNLKNPVSKTVKTPPVLAICDNQDKNKTVVIGAGNTKMPMSLTVFDLGCKGQEDTFEMMEKLIQKHMKQAPSKALKNPQIKYQVEIKYDIYGKSLKHLPIQDASMRSRDRHASISLDVSCKKCVFTPSVDDPGLKMNLNLELVVGHEILTLNHLWNELCVLQSFLELLSDVRGCSDGNTVVSKNAWDDQHIFEEISFLATTNTYTVFTQRACLDLANLRDLDVLDKLWDILKNCENLYMLKQGINSFLQELAESERKLPVLDGGFTIAIVVNKIIDESLLIAPINFAHALEFLFEMGVRKLKKDYQTILSSFEPGVISKIDSVFSSYFAKYKPYQGTRLSVRVDQLRYLGQLHVAAEFILLVKNQVNLFGETLNVLCKCVSDEYVQNTTKIKDFLEIYQTPLQIISLQLPPKAIRMIQDLYPVKWTLEMCYVTTGKTEMTFVYNLSESPIFPPAIVNYELPVLDENSIRQKIYYAAYMKRQFGFF